jgi:competence protein ComEC
MIFRIYLSSPFFNDFQRWPLWLPVFLGLGICLYFSLTFEPPLWIASGGMFVFGVTLVFVRLQLLRLLCLSIGMITLGFSVALFRTYLLHTQMLHYPLPPLILEGCVNQVELKPTQQGTFYQRLILTNLKAETAEKLPKKIRLSLRGKRERLWPGQIIRLKAKLNPILESSLPRGFDFRRQAYFNGIGAAGFALSSPELVGYEPNWRMHLEKRREEITTYFLTHLPTPSGAIAAALVTRDKSAIPEDVREHFINSGLAHILAISGLHLTIIAGVVFMIIRRSIALIPPLCLAYNSKKMAAMGTIFMTLFYLILSGFGIPAQRAFIMITVVMGAILMDRTALSMRTVALAASIILIIMPESLLGPSFQLSFAAVVSLVAGYEAWKNPMAHWIMGGGVFRKGLVYAGGLVFTSMLATLATLPFTIYFFHRFSLHAIEANLVAIPLTSLILMPSALLTCLLTPIGLGESPLWVFEKSLGLLIQIATIVSSWPGANVGMTHPPGLSFGLGIVGGLWLCLWQQSWRRWGFVPLAVGLLTAFSVNTPHLLIDGQGKLAGFYKEKTLYLSSTRKGKFTAKIWQQFLAAKDIKSMSCEKGVCKTLFRNIPLIISYQKENQPCVKGAVLIRFDPSQKVCPEAALTLDWYDLWREGSHVIWLDPQGFHLETVRTLQGDRPWSRKSIPRKLRPMNREKVQ